MIKKYQAVSALFALVAAASLGGLSTGAAFADDLPVEELAPAAVQTVKLDPFCHSGDGVNFEWINPASEGQLNGHSHHDADIFGGTEAECLALNVVVEEPTPFVAYAASARWLLPASWERHVTPSYQAAIFPQDRLADGAAVPCDRWSQDDGYWIETEAEEWVWVSLGDVLTQGEDSVIYASHVFTYGGDCEEQEEPPVEACECTSPNTWGTEADDTEPTQTATGLVFTGGSGNAVGYGTPLTGNLQGLGEITVSATGDLDVFYPRIVINSLADGGYAYDSLTVISEGPVNGSSIAASNKRGFEQHTLDEWAALLPHNQLVAFFLHLDSGASADQSVTVTAVDGECISLDTVPEEEEPPVDTPEEPTKPTAVKAGDAQVNPWLASVLALFAAAAVFIVGRRLEATQQ